MMTLLLGAALGLLGPPRLDAMQVISRTCNYAGVFHMEVGGRYALTLAQARQMCESLGTALASQEDITKAYAKGLETCRYGWISNGNATILRHTHHPNCSNNLTGIFYTTETEDATYDTYCHNASDTSEKNCEKKVVPVPLGSESLPANDENSDFGAREPDLDEGTLDVGTLDVGTLDKGTLDDAPVVINATARPDSTKDNVTTSDPGAQGTEDWIPVPTVADDSAERDERLTTTVSHQDEKPEVDGPHPTTPSTEDVFGDSNGSGSQLDTVEEERETTAASPTDLDDIKSTIGKSVIPKGHGPVMEPTSKFSGNAKRGRMEDERAQVPKPTSSPRYSSGAPGWLIILTVVVAVAVIVLVIAAFVTRNRWCGKQQTLMISKEGAEGNGATGGARAEEREQEMVTLMHKETIQENGNKEEFTCVALEEPLEKDQLA
ncbi:CD44 antigen [Scleropages formosus]|uniref:CD44 antigen n=1 Tax=Scleropages formosus TaxID=113540 RepID=UPI0008782095|nr:CD44 antigen [Scleropages formosus]XP_018620803.1 CD44 antigen [Scleropages formosus]